MTPATNSIANTFRWPNRIRVSFDLDDTLTGHCCNMPVEKSILPSFIQNWLREPLRGGTRRLFRELRHRNCSIWIYTSSGRSLKYIQLWFLMHGLRIDGVINRDRHQQAPNRHYLKRLPSKFPPAFGIDLHIDDSEGVKMEGDKYGFRVLVICPHDKQWTEKVLDAVFKLKYA